MGLLDSLERGLERAVNGAFARTFRSGVQPVEIAAALKRELDVQSIVVDRDRIITSNEFSVRVSAEDAEKLDSHGESVVAELTRIVTEHATQQGYQFLGPVSVAIIADKNLALGVLEVKSNKPSSKSSWAQALIIGGKTYPLHSARTVIGRGSDCDIQITDAAASRKHLEILVSGKRIIARDLNSTNGTKFKGERFKELELAPNTEFTIGKTALVFQLVPVAADKPQSSTPRDSFLGGAKWAN